MKSVAILQSSYIPWKGYFDLIKSVDEFILYDDVQYSKGDWRNRNRIKTANGVKWLTIAVNLKRVWPLNINNVQVSDKHWNSKHWDFIKQMFAGAAHYDEAIQLLKPLYDAPSEELLSDINERFLRYLCDYLAISTPITRSVDYTLVNTDKNERVLELCLKSGATTYVSGPAGANYLDHQLFADNGVTIEYFDYAGYPEYTQCHGEFEHHVSIIDMIFNLGERSKEYFRNNH